MRNVLEYLERTAARVPDKTAFADEAHTLTFSQLLAGSRAVGTLVARRAEKSRPVGVLVGRDAYTPLGFFAALQAGCCYVPLDPQMPSARLDAILRKACGKYFVPFRDRNPHIREFNYKKVSTRRKKK